MKKQQKITRKFSVKKQREKVKLREESVSIVGVLYEGLIDKDSVLVSAADNSGSAYEVPVADIVNQTVVEKGVDGDIIELDIRKEAIVVVVQFESAQRLVEISARMGGRPGWIGSRGGFGVQCLCSGGCICSCRTNETFGTTDGKANSLAIGDYHDAGSLGIYEGRFYNPLPGKHPGLL